MPVVIRWFMETEDHEIIDGPFKSKSVAIRQAVMHKATYRYEPVVVAREIEIMDPIPYGDRVSFG